ncbi:hypothetical protein ABEF95_003878 [Exophiala dermatitidis]|uniref:Uncharacterized protein n=1 Tax=Exophiala dermatitidis (strain ATCC 34100 / CBS 525.76 / NIH/UT8656) TaxID=858893 RepID=H6BQ28_EXODN|nr:uncharacterized protein HMPREF1120_02642 [Exophiala dermatitidis NIH/UT8656]EHY54474.1 hypothetical protein HMPREF1120_02642 [Exophiala dermatitidis NIH/UT8656]
MRTPSWLPIRYSVVINIVTVKRAASSVQSSDRILALRPAIAFPRCWTNATSSKVGLPNERSIEALQTAMMDSNRTECLRAKGSSNERWGFTGPEADEDAFPMPLHVVIKKSIVCCTHSVALMGNTVNGSTRIPLEGKG